MQYRWQALLKDGRLRTEPEDYHSLDRSNVGEFGLIDESGNTVVKILCTPDRTFFHRRRGFIKPAFSTEVRIIGYWSADDFLGLWVWPNGKVETLKAFIGDHVVYGKIDLFESEVVDLHRVGAHG